MDVSPVLVADLQAPEADEPGERPSTTHRRPPVASQAVLGLDTTAGDAADEAALAQGQTEMMVVVTLVGMKRVRSAMEPAARLGSDGLDGVDRASIIFESCMFASFTRTARGMLWASTTRWCFVPCVVRWPRSVRGLARFLAPSRGRCRSGVQRGPVPVDTIGLGQFFEKYLVHPAPDARVVPGSQPAPARYPAPTPHLGRQVFQECPSSARTGSPPVPPGPTPGVVRPWTSGGAAARSAPTTHQATVPSLWRPPHDSYSASLAAYATVLLGVLSHC
jgi:hypothetical protein